MGSRLSYCVGVADDDIKKVFYEAFGEEGYQCVSPEGWHDLFDQYQWHTLKLSGSVVAICASDEICGSSAGYACVKADKVSSMFLMSFAVSPQYQRQGLGRILLGNIITFYQSQARRLQLSVDPNNARAYKLYEMNGFKVIGLCRSDLLMQRDYE